MSAHGRPPSRRHHAIRIAGSALAFDAAEGDNLLRAGLRAGIGLPYECNAGGCGSCKFELLSGEVQELWPDAPGLSAKDHQRGRRLACQCIALSDCEIKIRPADAFVAAHAPARFEAEFIGDSEVTTDIREFRFRAPQAARFAPGQYALLTLPETSESRAYSMSNQPNDEGTWAFMVRRVAGGRISPRLFDTLRVGDRVEIDGPLGFAHWRPEAGREVVCIAGGSGFAPIASISNAAMQQPGAALPVWLFYGGRTPSDIPRFSDWIVEGAQLRLHPAISSVSLPGSSADGAQPMAWDGEQGLIHEVMGRTLTGDPAAREYYLAGPPPMIETVVRMLIVDNKVPASQIHYDRFF